MFWYKDKYNKQVEENKRLVQEFNELFSHATLQQTEIVRITCDLVAMEMALTELYDKETVNAIITRSKSKAEASLKYLKDIQKAVNPGFIQISLNFFN